MSLIAKVHTVHAVDAALRDSTQMGFPLAWPLVKASFIVKVHTVHAVNAVLRGRHTDWFA